MCARIVCASRGEVERLYHGRREDSVLAQSARKTLFRVRVYSNSATRGTRERAYDAGARARVDRASLASRCTVRVRVNREENASRVRVPLGLRRFLLACVPSMRAYTMAHDRATSDTERTFSQRSRNEGQKKSGDPTGTNSSITIEIVQLRSVGYVSRRGYRAFQSAIQTPLCIYKSLCAPVCTRVCMEEWRARRPWLVGNNFRMNLNGTLRAPSPSPPLLLLSPTTS